MIDGTLVESAERWLPVLVTVAVKATVLLAAAALLVSAGRRCSASARHLVWVLAIGGAFVLPMLAVLDPQWLTVPIASPVRDAGIARLSADFVEVSPAVPVVDGQRAAKAAMEDWRRPASTAATVPTRPFIWLAVLWLVGVVALAVRAGLGLTALSRFVRRSSPVDDAETLRILRECCDRLGRRGRVELRDGGSGCMPTTCGIRRAVVILPTQARRWGPERLRAVLLHEIAHVVRRDCLTMLLAQLSCIVHWYNPAAWYARRRLIGEAERAADDLVLQCSVEPVDYAQHLLSIAVQFSRRSSLTSAPGMARCRDLEQRLHALLESSCSRRRVSKFAGVIAVHIAAVLVLGLAGFTIGPAAAQSTDRSGPVAALEPAPPQEDDDNRARRLIRQLEDQRASEGRSARGELRILGADHPITNAVVDGLLDDLGADDGTVRRAATRGLGRSGVARAFAPLLVLRADRDSEVRSAAAGALGRLGDVRAVEPLVAMLDDGEPLVREWAVRGLGLIGDNRAVDPVIGMLSDENAAVREWAVRTLVGYDDPRAAGAITFLVADDDPAVREWVARTICSARGASAMIVLILLADDEDRSVREAVARGLGSMGDSGGVETLIGMLEDPDPNVREWAVRSLGGVGDRRAVQALFPLLRDDDVEIREWTIRSLGSLGDRRAVRPLLPLIDDDAGEVREWAIRSLAALPDPVSVGPLARVLRAGTDYERVWAVRALAAIDTPAARRVIERALDDEYETVREIATRALGPVMP